MQGAFYEAFKATGFVITAKNKFMAAVTNGYEQGQLGMA